MAGVVDAADRRSAVAALTGRGHLVTELLEKTQGGTRAAEGTSALQLPALPVVGRPARLEQGHLCDDHATQHRRAGGTAAAQLPGAAPQAAAQARHEAHVRAPDQVRQRRHVALRGDGRAQGGFQPSVPVDDPGGRDGRHPRTNQLAVGHDPGPRREGQGEHEDGGGLSDLPAGPGHDLRDGDRHLHAAQNSGNAGYRHRFPARADADPSGHQPFLAFLVHEYRRVGRSGRLRGRALRIAALGQDRRPRTPGTLSG